MSICIASILALALAGCRYLPGGPVGSAASADVGLVAHWTFDEGSGSVARDVTGHGHDAALKNTEWVPSPRGFALRFDSKDDLAQYGQFEAMNLSGDVSLAVWAKTDASVGQNTHRLIFGDSGYGIERNLHLSVDGYQRLSFEWADGKTNASLLAPAALLNGAWKHIVVVANSGATLATLYVDGVEVARVDMPLPISKAPAKERLTGWFYNGFFQGDLDDIRLYARVLTPEEVMQLFAAQEDMQIDTPAVRFDASQAEPRGLVTTTLRNGSREPRQVEVTGPAAPRQDLTLAPGASAEVTLGQVPLRPVWPQRTDLFVSEAAADAGRATVSVRRGEQTEPTSLALAPQQALAPLQVQVQDPWQRDLARGRTKQLDVSVRLAVPAAQLREGALRLRLVAPATGEEMLRQTVLAPTAALALSLDVRALPWGAYHLQASFLDRSGRAAVTATRLATILPDGKQRIVVLNNLVSELMDARGRGLLTSPRVEFMNPRQGWVWFQAAGACSVRLGDDAVLTAEAGKPAAEAMRLLPAGRHALQVTGTPADLLVRAIPALVYNVFPSAPQITPFGSNTWERLREHTLPNTNMIEGQVVDTPEQREWLAQKRSWLGNVQAPGLIDQQEWTVAKMLDVWRKPGTPTAHPERPGFDLAKLSGLQVDEYYSGLATDKVLTTALSVAALAEDPAFAGKLWIPFVVDMFGNPTAELFMQTVLGAGWPFSVEVYVGEMPTEAENLSSIRARFRSVAAGWEKAYPGSLRRTIFTPMYAYLPYCTSNRYPQADFRVHLDQQMQVLATDPAFFGLWGVQPYRSNYVDREILNCMGRLLRHYCIEGKTEPLLTDPYELRHIANPDFEQGTAAWQLAPAEAGSISAGSFAGYGQLQGRYPAGTMGDTFLIMKRSAAAANSASQPLQGLEKGRLYSLKLITGDYADLQAGKSRKDPQAVTITLTGAEVLPGGFSYPFRSARGPTAFTTEAPFWMTYHWLQFRAQGPTATLAISDWAKPTEPGGPAGQHLMLNFVEIQPVLE